VRRENVVMLTVSNRLNLGSLWLSVIRVAAVLAMIAAAGLGLLGYFWLPLDRISVFTVFSICVIFLAAESRLTRSRIYTKVQSVLLAVLYANSFVWTYEILYYYTFPGDWGFASLGDEAIIFVQLIPILILGRHLNLTGRIAMISGLALLSLWILWIASGFTQFWHLAPFYSQVYVHLPNVYWDSFAINYASKLALAGVFVGLILPRKDVGAFKK
jgi:hypothetical protein